MNKPTSEQIRTMIVTVLEVAHPEPQTHEDIARKLAWLTNRHRIAMNIDSLVRNGSLRILPEDPTGKQRGSRRAGQRFRYALAETSESECPEPEAALA